MKTSFVSDLIENSANGDEPVAAKKIRKEMKSYEEWKEEMLSKARAGLERQRQQNEQKV